MKKEEFIRELSSRAGVTIKLSRAPVEEGLSLIVDTLESVETVDFRGYFTFEVKNNSPYRKYFAPEDREIDVSAKKKIKLKKGNRIKALED